MIEIASIRQDYNLGSKDLGSLSAPTLQDIENRLRLPMMHAPAPPSAMLNFIPFVMDSEPACDPGSLVSPAKLSKKSVLVHTEDEPTLCSAASKIVGVLLLSFCFIKVKLTD